MSSPIFKRQIRRQMGHLNSAETGAVLATCCLSFLADRSLSRCSVLSCVALPSVLRRFVVSIEHSILRGPFLLMSLATMNVWKIICLPKIGILLGWKNSLFFSTPPIFGVPPDVFAFIPALFWGSVFYSQNFRPWCFISYSAWFNLVFFIDFVEEMSSSTWSARETRDFVMITARLDFLRARRKELPVILF